MNIQSIFKKKMNKHGAMFTLLAIIMVMLLTLIVISNNSNVMQEKSLVIEERIKSVDFFINDMERDIKRGMYITTFRALLGIQQHISTTGKYVENLSETFQELILNGTINSSYLSVMNNTEMNQWFSKIKYEAEKISIELDYEIYDVNVTQIDQWTILVTLLAKINVSDSQGIAYWIREKPLNTTLSIIDFEDPLYSVNTGVFANTIKKTNVTLFVNGSDTSGLITHVENMYYKESDSAPSYLMRLSGNLNSSPLGIESLVNLLDLESIGITAKNKSCVDYIYFSNSNPTFWNINNTFSWLRIDNQSNHLEEYQIENVTY